MGRLRAVPTVFRAHLVLQTVLTVENLNLGRQLAILKRTATGGSIRPWPSGGQLTFTSWQVC
ncbi:MAG: hypothetical protein KA354_19855 [Phycisphaerae bacterium]|nr:hypothetical protein [Phycisphaerae bacterium]